MTIGGPPAGLFANTAYEQETTELRSGNRVVFVTDGITECLPGGCERAIAGLNGHLSARDLRASILQLCGPPAAVTPFSDWEDDRTVVVLAVE